MKKKKYILAIDQGTSSSRALLFDENGEIAAIEQKRIRIKQNGLQIEQDADEILQSQIDVVQKILLSHRIDADDLLVAGITNQRETIVAWDRNTGKAICPAISWQDSRTKDWCNKLLQQNKGSFVRHKTGLLIGTYFSAGKIVWILENIPDARLLAQQNRLCVGTVDTWLLWKLSNGEIFATDHSNASRTLLYNIHEGQWDEELLSLFHIPQNILPEIKESAGNFGSIEFPGIRGKINVFAVLGDQQSALFGQQCHQAGEVKNTYGTGCFMLMNTGHEIKTSEHGLLSTVAWKFNGNTTYALEGSVFNAGSLLQFLRDQLRVIKNVADSEHIAYSLEDNDGVYIVPAFSGLGSPYWDANAEALITGVKRNTSYKHIIRAALESIAYQNYDVLNAMRVDSGIDIPVLKADGGASRNQFLMQFQSNICELPVWVNTESESTAQGVAFLAGLHCGFYKQFPNLSGMKQYTNSIDGKERNLLLDGWNRAIRKSRHS